MFLTNIIFLKDKPNGITLYLLKLMLKIYVFAIL